MILLFVRLKKRIELPLNNSTCLLNSILVLIYKEKSAIRKKFENTRFLKNLNQGNLTLEHTQIFSKHISSGKKIRGFGASEQFFIMLSLGIYFVNTVKSPKLKRSFYVTVKALFLDFNSRKFEAQKIMHESLILSNKLFINSFNLKPVLEDK